jgi:N-acetylmuramoyl-L-alanine amidase
MRVARHRLLDFPGGSCEWTASPNVGGKLQPEYLVMHYTAGSSLQESVSWLSQSASKASAHVVIGRDGRIVQQVPFDTVAWHAGASTWEGLVGLNRYAIGIELDNAGRLVRQGSKWRAWFGGKYDSDDVIEATHKHESAPAGWHTYTQVQLQVALDLATFLIQEYGLRDVIGHEDISPGRKSDPGPAFPMESFRARVLGRAEETPPRYRCLAALNVRSGPGTQHQALPGSPLPVGTQVEIVRQQDSWRLVDVLEEVGGISDIHGWVHHRFLERVPETRGGTTPTRSRGRVGPTREAERATRKKSSKGAAKRSRPGY